MKEQQSEPPLDEQPEVMMADVLVLSDELRTLVSELIRLQEASLLEIAGLVEKDEITTHNLLAHLIAQGFVQGVQHEGEDQLRYRIRLSTRRGRALPLDL